MLAEGIDLIGEYEGSGFKETPYLARRMDGQVLQLTQLLYLVAEEVDGERNFGEIAERVTEKFGRAVSADNIKFLVEEKLRPIGVLAAADGTSPKLEKADPMLALNFRAGLVPERAVRVITSIFYPLFFLPVMIAVVAGLVALDVWLFFVHGVAQSVRDIAYDPVLFLMVFGLVVLSAAFHECGHATACRYGGATPGQMGAGIYLVYPAFFSDVTDVYRLGKVGRVRTDLGGIYFNMIFSLLTAGAYFLTGFEPLLAIIVIQHLEMIHQLLPFLRLDGYYIVSDITGVPDLFSRIRPILSSLVPGREPGPAVTALKPWARAVVTAWVLTMVPVLLYMFVLAGMTMPRMFATAYDSFFVQWGKLTEAVSEGDGLRIASGSIQLVSLVLPLTGLTYTMGRAGKNLGTAAWTRTQDRPALRTALVAAVVAAAGLLVFLWWPNGDYKPIQPGERGTIQGSLLSVRDIPGGRPGLTPEREQELMGAPGPGGSEGPGSGAAGSGDKQQGAQPGAEGGDGQLQDAQQSEGQPSGQEVSIPDAQQEISVPQEEVSVPQEEVSVPEISQPEVSIPAESTVP
jgi:putative peptide zinc metalloprotease protein